MSTIGEVIREHIDRPDVGVDTKPVSYHRRSPVVNREQPPRSQAVRNGEHPCQWESLDTKLEVFERKVANRTRWVHMGCWALSVITVVSAFTAWLWVVREVMLFATSKLNTWEHWGWMTGVHVIAIFGAIAVGAWSGLMMGRTMIDARDRRVQRERRNLHNGLRARWATVDTGLDDIGSVRLSLQETATNPFAYLGTEDSVSQPDTEDHMKPTGQWDRLW